MRLCVSCMVQWYSCWQPPHASSPPPRSVTHSLSQQVGALQEEFKHKHRHLESIRHSTTTTAVLKRDIQQAEEEKQQVQFKISKIKAKVQEIPAVDKILEAARRLRAEQKQELTLTDKIQEQRAQTSLYEKKLAMTRETLGHVKEVSMGNGVDKFFQRLQEEAKVNTYLAQERLPKGIEEAGRKLRELSKIVTGTSVSEGNIRIMEVGGRALYHEFPCTSACSHQHPTPEQGAT